MKLSELAAQTGARCEVNDAEIEIEGAAGLDQARLGQVTFWPAPAPFARLRGEHRVQLLIKSRGRRRLRQLVDAAVAKIVSEGHSERTFNIEIDPISMM